MSRLPKKTFLKAFAKMAFMLTSKIFEKKFQTESNVKKLVKASTAIKSTSEKICPEANSRLATFGLLWF